MYKYIVLEFLSFPWKLEYVNIMKNQHLTYICEIICNSKFDCKNAWLHWANYTQNVCVEFIHIKKEDLIEKWIIKISVVYLSVLASFVWMTAD